MQNGDTVSERPWGYYFKMYQESGVWVKRVLVKPHCRLSLQKHHQRSEKWIVVKGSGIVIIDKNEIAINAGDVVDVPLGAVHRICNTADDDLIFIEVACGQELSEEDIVRLEDDYAR